MSTWHGSGARHVRLAGALLTIAPLGLASVACTPEGVAPVDTQVSAASAPVLTASGGLDVLFMIDNSSGMTSMQEKLAREMPSLISGLGSSSNGLPSIHVAVVSSDLGAPGENSPDKTSCSQAGDQGAFRTQPRGTCTDSTLAAGATFVSNGDGVANYTGANLADVVQCILPLGDGGCQFVHPLAALTRALGADGTSAPTSNASFLRPDAMLAIIILTHQDDCSASSPNTALYSLNNGPDNLINSLGPLTPYRCNEWGHLCVDPHSNNPVEQPPEMAPSDAQGTPSAPTLNLADCESNENGGLLTPVGTFVDEIRGLKHDPDHQIVVGAVAAPPSPYAVAWVPAAGAADGGAGQLWPRVEHSCGAANGDDVDPQATQLATDGSFGDPGVRVTQFVKAFGTNGVIGSVCDASYATFMQEVATLVATNVPLITVGVTGTAGAGGTVAGTGPDGGSFVTGTAGGPGLSGSGGSLGSLGGGGAAGGHATSGLRSGGCSLGASAPGGSGMAALLVALAAVRRRAGRTRGARKNLT